MGGIMSSTVTETVLRQNPPEKPYLARCLRKALGFVDPVRKRELAQSTTEEVVRYLLDGDGAGESFQKIRDLKSQTAVGGNMGLYRTWRLRQMVESPYPFREMMTLFWLDMFAISALRMKELTSYHAFCNGLEERALAPWTDILAFVLEHPAFLLNLRAERNYRSMPHRQLGEFVVEHVMGLDPAQHQDDVSSVARAFTGLFVRSGELRRYDYEHDPAAKAIAGNSGDFWPRDVAQILARDAQVAAVLANRLYRWFIASEGDVPPTFLQPVVNQILSGRASGEIVAEAIMMWCTTGEPSAKRVKSPLEVFLALVRPLKGRVTTALADLVAELGWDLLHPPTYSGWPKGRDWLTTAQMARRISLAESLLLKEDRFGGGIDLPAVAKTLGYNDDWPGLLVDALLDDGIPPEAKDEWDRQVKRGPSEALLFLVALPEFSLS